MRVTVTLVFLALFGAGCSAQCVESISKASGTKAPATFCKGDLIFDEEFDVFDVTTWEHERTMAGGGNWEFEVYTNNRSNTFAQDGSLHIRPTLTSDHYGEEFLSSGTISLLGGAPADACTDPSSYGCERTGSVTNLLNPAQSARIRSINSFSFRYGKVEIRARMPSGDWLWPALWLLPRYNAYSTWPASGEIDLAELRGNLDYVQNGVNIGTEQSSSTLHFGPYWPLNAYESAHFSKNTPAGAGFDKDYHLYQMEWTSDYMKFSVDNEELGTVTPNDQGFWGLGGFSAINPTAENPWRFGTKMAPFDQEFYFLMNLAVGGVNGYFPDDGVNAGGKPWINTSPQASTDFWNGRSQWLPTWHLDENNGESASLLVDYVKVWAV